MDTGSSSNTRELARSLLTASRPATDPHPEELAAVIEKLRTCLTKLAGADGFTSLLRRALALASEDVPWLRGITVGKDGRLEGMNRSGTVTERSPEEQEATVVLITHLLELLITLIGRRITLRLVKETWPETSMEAWQWRIEADC